MNRDKVKCYIYTRVSTAIQVDGFSDCARYNDNIYADVFMKLEL